MNIDRPYYRQIKHYNERRPYKPPISDTTYAIAATFNRQDKDVFMIPRF